MKLFSSFVIALALALFNLFAQAAQKTPDKDADKKAAAAAAAPSGKKEQKKAAKEENKEEPKKEKASGGVWKTVNDGTTWTPLFDGEGSYSIGWVALDPNDTSVVWVGAGESNSQRSV